MALKARNDLHFCRLFIGLVHARVGHWQRGVCLVQILAECLWCRHFIAAPLLALLPWALTGVNVDVSIRHFGVVWVQRSEHWLFHEEA